MYFALSGKPLLNYTWLSALYKSEIIVLKFFRRLLRYIKSQIQLNKNLTEEESHQKQEGYQVDLRREGAEMYIFYKDEEKESCAGVSFNFLNDATLYTKSFEKWGRPKHKAMSQTEYQRALQRIVKYLFIWGDVTLDDSPIEDIESVKESLRQRGIPFEEVDGLIVYKMDADSEEYKKEMLRYTKHSL